jgi:6-phosphogluconate dehydrogenase
MRAVIFLLSLLTLVSAKASESSDGWTYISQSSMSFDWKVSTNQTIKIWRLHTMWKKGNQFFVCIFDIYPDTRSRYHGCALAANPR